ncbi:TlpA family protein disulfide reductase [Runella slithyformis]|uniref:Alkyl hydroperoxide reductase/ Thiol specific antioxidant/ Mal allergen n=1 Tax=Runella slithyformis (strain ATCC 29530 / DSM 19594 / LMG 11500 / NCIMB 11436 / LSU 4) TaxID=761193 RepID=A0A7U3ZNU8_RUNSL|nr:TlpA disulfide reductase family protein [Runella slithyformis]AEI50558.1 alkyl hydroperoxide reductase/ Thiol specific antioxidant/ Mal allergen [Runella slithyformis DSM 19594]
MKKGYLKFALLFGLAVASIYLGYSILHKMAIKKAVAARVAQLPAFQFTNLSGGVFTPQQLAQKPTWLLYFDSTCEFCQMEITDLDRHKEKLTAVQLVLISAEETAVLQKFVRQHSFAQLSNVAIVQDHNHQCPKLLGMNTTPSSLLYDASGRLVERFGGVVKVEKIISLLNEN